MEFLALSFFGDLERFSADYLYPHRLIVAAVLVVLALGSVFVALRLRVPATLLRHRRASLLIGSPLLAIGLLLGNYLLSPLWQRSHLEEESPIVATAQRAGLDVPPAAQSKALATIRRAGSFRGADGFHYAEGKAELIEAEGGRWLVRFESFRVRNGPDLYVYLSRGDENSVDEMLNLGRLKATDGAFNYDIPAGIQLSEVSSVVVWCRQFGVRFGSAMLSPL